MCDSRYGELFPEVKLSGGGHSLDRVRGVDPVTDRDRSVRSPSQAPHGERA